MTVPRTPLPPTSPLALTMGEPAGIGPEITLAAYATRHETAIPPFVCYADPGLLSATAATLGMTVTMAEVADGIEAIRRFETALPVIPVRLAVPAVPGHPDARNGTAAIISIDRAVNDVIAGRAAAVVTNPIAKAVLYEAGFRHPGHTEYLAHLADRQGSRPPAFPVMMLASTELKVVPVTIHIPLASVPTGLTTDLIERTIITTERHLRSDFAIENPRIAVAGLNPHAGENGTIGLEDRDVVAPAIERLRAQGLAVTGPHPADTMFHPAARRRYDAAVCMYHDQALIPIKTLAFDTGVNVTLGLPFVRTSPDHGTAFDIAGRGVASPASLIEALRLARRMADARAGARVPAGERLP